MTTQNKYFDIREEIAVDNEIHKWQNGRKQRGFTDWDPHYKSQKYRDNFDRIFGKKEKYTE